MGIATTGALGACCLAAVGCGGSGGPQGPLGNQTGAQVLAEASADLEAAPGATMYSTGIDSGQYTTVYAGIVPGKGCTVTVMLGMGYAQGSMTYIRTSGAVYFKLDSAMWQLLAGANAASVTQELGGRYIEISQSDTKVHIPGLGSCDYADPKAWAGAIAKGQVTTLNGVPVLPLKDSRGDVIYVTDTSKPEIVQIDAAPIPGTTGPAGESTFTVGPVKLAPPPASQVVSGATLGL